MNGTGVFTFVRAVITSQLSSYVDWITSFVFFAAVGLNAAVATAIGAAAGGVANCLINYRFTFRTLMRQCSYWAIGIKFFLVWLGSLTLNSLGTLIFTNLLTDSRALDKMGMSEDLRFTIARLSVALLVSVFWNFILMRAFVFRATKFDNFIDRVHYYLAATRFHKR